MHLATASAHRFHQLPPEKRGTRTCSRCGEVFVPKTGCHKYCTPICKNKVNQVQGSMTVANQYLRISGDFLKYFARLVNHKRRGLITKHDMMEILEKQNHKCALSGVELTCFLEQGKRFLTNASLDQIIPGNGYSKDNVRLVCIALNSWRGTTSDDDFVWWCKQVIQFREGGQ